MAPAYRLLPFVSLFGLTAALGWLMLAGSRSAAKESPAALSSQAKPMLIGYVSDERFVALPDVLLEFEGEGDSVEARSRATGAVYAALRPDKYRVTLSKPGYGSKHVEMTVRPDQAYQFRLLSDGLFGYAWPKCVRSGESSEMRVHAVEEYRLELWRYGWDKHKLNVISVVDEHGPRATMQITPDGDYTQTGVHWNEVGYLGRSKKVEVQAPERSGLYYIHARAKSGRFFSFPWIVAPKRPTAKLAILASNINWNAYNNFGGRSNYILAGELPPRPTVNARQDLSRYTDADHVFYDREDYAPLSFERPEPMNHIDEDEKITDVITGRNACHIAPAEWRLLGWLEREGFEYDLYAETQLHFETLKLDDYQVLILSTHPEYWSKAMYNRLKDWVVNRGGKLMYLGGNGLNCEVEFLDERTMTVRNGNARLENADRFESRFHRRHESEANLLGVVFTDAGIMTAAPYRVLEDQHWVFAGTGLKNGDLFGTKSLHMRCHGGASGHETDKVSPSSPKNVQVLAKGLNPDEGGADLAYYETPSGGAVFAAGSICWPASIAVDDGVSKITANVLRRFLGQ